MGRSASQQEIDGWLPQAVSPLGRVSLVAAFLTSNENHAKTVDAYYDEYLGRPADETGKSFWLSALTNDQASFFGLAQQLLASDEYYRRS